MTALYGIFGWPVSHSRSPAMQGGAFAALGIDAVYVPFAVPPNKLAEAVEAARVLGVQGLNITLPHKQEVMALLDEVEAPARGIGAVNTVLRDGERLIGTNTDAEGLARSLTEAGVTLQGARITLLGAGGAARAAVVGLAAAGAAQICVAARRAPQAQQLVERLASYCGQTNLSATAMDAALRDRFCETDLLVQSTSATLTGSAQAQPFADSLPIASLPASAVVCDLVYKPRTTTVMAAAEARGLKTVDGLGMLLHQGALAFERWTQKAAPIDVMRAALEG